MKIHSKKLTLHQFDKAQHLILTIHVHLTIQTKKTLALTSGEETHNHIVAHVDHLELQSAFPSDHVQDTEVCILSMRCGKCKND